MADKILGGGSCEGLDTTFEGTTVDEIRKTRDDSHPNFWPAIDICLDKGTQIYLNFDSFTKDHRGWDSESDLRQEVEATIMEYERRIFDRNLGLRKTRNRTLLILDNEFEEVPGASIEKYLYWLGIFKGQINGRYEIGAGNFSSNLRYMPWYRELAKYYNKLYQVFCIHLQSDFETKSKMDKNKKEYQKIINDYNIENITCTEGVPTSWNLPGDFPLVKYQLNIAKELGCMGYCAVFIKGSKSTIPSKWHDFVFSMHPPALELFLKLIKENKPEEEEYMELDEIYKEGSKGIGVRLIQKVLNKDMSPDPLLKEDGWWGPKTNVVVLDYQDKYGLSKYGGAIGPNTMQAMIKQYPDIWDNIQYLWSIGYRQ